MLTIVQHKNALKFFESVTCTLLFSIPGEYRNAPKLIALTSFVELLHLKEFCSVFRKASDSGTISAISEALFNTMIFLDYDLADEESLWLVPYGVPVHALAYIKRFINKVPKGFVTKETCLGVILAAIVTAR